MGLNDQSFSRSFAPNILRTALALVAFGLFVVGLALPSSQPAVAAAGINKTINFQGRLLTAAGAVVADGNYNMRFKVYQDGDGTLTGDTGGSGGALKWTEEYKNSLSEGVVVKNGYYSVALGTYCAFSGSACTGGQTQGANVAVDWNQDTLWLSMDVGGTTAGAITYDGELLPMRRMSSAVYALQAQNSNTLGGLTSAGFIQNATSPQSGGASFNFVSAAPGNIGGQIQAASSGTAAVMVLKDGTSSTGDLLQLQNSAGNNLLRVDAAGNEASSGSISTPNGGFGPIQNLLGYSEQFDMVNIASTNFWTPPTGVVVTPDSTAAPNGASTADTLAGTGNSNLLQLETGVHSAGTYTFSVWLKQLSGAATTGLCILSAGGTPTTCTATPVTPSSSDWQRFSVTQVIGSTPTSITAEIKPGNGATGSVYAWGAQLVRDSVPEVYVHTMFNAQPATYGASAGDLDANVGFFTGNLNVAAPNSPGAFGVADETNNTYFSVDTANGIVSVDTNFLTSTSSATALQVVNGSSNQVLTVDTTFNTNQGQVILGKASTNNGRLLLNNSTNANTVAIVSGATSASGGTGYALTLPLTGGAGAQCLQSTGGSTVSTTTLIFGGCGGTTPTLQQVYAASSAPATIALTNNASNGITISNVLGNASSTGALLNLSNAYTGAMDGLDISSAGTGALLKVTDSTTTAADVLTIADGGAATFKSQTNSTSSFQIQNASATSFFTADSTKDIITTNDLSVGAATTISGNGRLFSDGFENGNATVWAGGVGGTGGTVTTNETTTVRNGKYSAKIITAANNGYVQSTINTSSTVFARTYFNATTAGNPTVLMDLGTAGIGSGTHLYVYLGASGFLCYDQTISVHTTACSATAPTTSTWHKLELRYVAGSGANGVLQVFLDNVLVVTNANAINISTGAWLGSITNFAIGNATTQTATTYFDDVSVDTVATGDSSSLIVNDTLRVSGTSTFGGTIAVVNNSNAAGNGLLAYSNGNGIGVYGSSNGYVGVLGQSTSGNSGLFQSSSSANGSATLVSQKQGTSSADLFQIQDTNAASFLRVDSNGNQETLGYINSGFGGIGAFGNLLVNSEQLDQSAGSPPWTSTTSPVTANSVAAPDGLTTADTLVGTGNSNLKQAETTGLAAGTYTFSVWLKQLSGAATTGLCIFATGGTGAPTTCTTTVVTPNTTDWQRFSVTQAITGASITSITAQIKAGNGSTASVYAWGAQLVVSSNPGVYVRTTTSTVAASQGVVSNGGAFISATNANDVPLVVQAAPAPSVDLFQVQGSAGASLFKVSNVGAVTAVGVNSGTGQIQGTGGLVVTGTTQINVTTAGTTTIGSSSAGAISVQGGAAGTTINDTAGGLTLSTTASGAISVTSAGTLAFSSTDFVVSATGNVTTGTWQGSAVDATHGGTGQSGYAVGDILFASTTTALSKLADIATGSCLITGGANTAPAWGSCNPGAIVQVPASTAINTITPGANSAVGLTVNATTNATSSPAAIFVQGNNAAVPADTVQASSTDTSGTQVNGILFTRNGTGGTTTNGINVTNTLGTLSKGLTLTATTAIGDGIFFTGGGGFTNLINATNFKVTNAGAVTAVGVNSGTGQIQGSGGLSITASGAGIVGTTTINNSGAATTAIGSGSAGVITLQSASTITLTGTTVVIAGAATVSSTLSVTGTINSVAGYKFNGTAGISLNCGTDQSLDDPTISGGIVTAGSCTAGGTWTAITLLGSGGTQWTAGSDINGTTYPPAWRLLPDGDIELRGVLHTPSSAWTNGTNFASSFPTVPGSKVTSCLVAQSTVNNFWLIELRPNGNMEVDGPNVGTGLSMHLDGCILSIVSN